MTDESENPGASRILICEDEGILAEDIAEILRSLGYKIAGIVTNGDAAVRAAEDTKPDLIIMDIKLAGEMDGIEAAAQIRSRRDIPLVYLTAYNEKTFLERAKRTQPYGYLGKPIGLSDLRSTVETALYRHRADKRVRDGEELYRALVETTDTGYVILDHEGKVLDANSEYLRLSGHIDIEEIRGRSVVEWTAEHDRNRNAEEVKECFRRGFVRNLEIDYVDKSGAVTPIEINATVVSMSGGTCIVTLCRDITARNKAEEALQQSQEQLKTIFETSPAAMFLVNPEGNITFANRRMGDLFSRRTEDLPGTPYVELVHPESRSVGYGKMKSLMCGEIDHVNLERRYIRADGSDFLGHLSGRRLLRSDGGLDGLVGIIEDVTERKKAEEDLRRSEERFRSLIDQAPDAIFVHDFDGRFLEVNRQAVNALGYSRDEFLSMSVNEIDPDTLIRGDSSNCWANLPATFEATHRRKDGTTFPVEIRLGPIEYGDTRVVLSVARDITDRKLSEKERRESENRYRSLVEASPDPILMYDLEGNLITVNQQAAVTYGVDSPVKLLAEVKKISQILDAEDQDKAYENMRQTLAKGVSRKAEYNVIRNDGSTFPVEVNSSTVRSADGEPIGFLSMVRDLTDRKRAEEEVKKSRGMIASILNSVPQSIFWKDRDGVYLGCNEVFAAAVGLDSPDQIVGKTDFDLPWPRDEAEAYRADDQEVMESENAKRHIVEPLQQADGTRLLIDTTKVLLVDQDNNVYGVLGVYEDITERKAREKALLESEERFRLTFQTSPDSISINRLGDGLYLDINDGFARITGYSREEVIGKTVPELNIWHNPQDRRRLIRSLQETGYVNNMEAKFRLKDGTVITGLMSARVIMLKGEPHIVSITRNIEDWIRTQEALRESEQRYRTLFEDSIDGVFSVLRDGTITDANASFYELFGYTREEMIGKDVRELHFDPADRLKFVKEIEEKGFVKDYEVKFRKKDGTEFDCLLTSSVHFGPDRSIAGHRGIIRDLTLRKGLQRQLLQAQKMEAIGTLAGGMAHDFNNLLQAILGFSDLLLMKKDPGDPDRKKLEVIQHAARDGADLVSRILTFSRRAESRKRPIDLNEEILEAQKLVGRTVPRMIEIKLVPAENLAIIDADPAQVEQVLLNLVVNAQHAMPDGGQLVIETSNVSVSDEYLRAHLDAKAGNYVLLSVSDTGVGIAPDVQDRIFEPFFTTKTNGEGTGLGLAMVHGIVSQHGGYVRCYSEPGIGTSFKIYFPVSATERLRESDETREMPASGNETILLVDDDDRVRDMAREMIRERGYQVLAARNGEEALAVYAAHKDDISLVILDLIMPGMGGWKCLEELLRIDPNVRALVASGYSSACLSEDDKGMGSVGFIGKPYDAKDILGAIRIALDKDHT